MQYRTLKFGDICKRIMKLNTLWHLNKVSHSFIQFLADRARGGESQKLQMTSNNDMRYSTLKFIEIYKKITVKCFLTMYFLLFVVHV